MKKLLIAAALLPLGAFAQKPYTLNGHVQGLKTGDKVYLIYQLDEEQKMDSAIVASGKFAFKGTLTEPVRATLFLNKNPYVTRPNPGEVMDIKTLFLEPATFSLKAADSLKNTVVSGSKINDDDTQLTNLMKPTADKIQALNADFNKLSNEQKQDPAIMGGLQSRYIEIQNGSYPVMLDYIKSHPNSFVSLTLANQLAGTPDQILAAEQAFKTLSASLKSSPTGVKVSSMLDINKKTAVGAMAMDFTQNDVNDKPVKLSDFKGKYVLVDFWASWCGPCRAENPNVVSAFNKFKDKNFTVLGVSLDNPGQKAAWLKAIEKDQLNWTQLSDLKGWSNAVAVQYGVRGIPANYLIDPSGKIIAKNVRGEELHTKLAEVLGAAK